MLGTSYVQEAVAPSFLCSRFVKHVFRVSASKKSSCDDDDMRTELDSHADTCVAGRNTLLVSDDGRQVTVHPYSGEYKPIQDVSIATVATMWIHPKNGQPYILIINEALYFGDRVDVTLLNPNQLRANGVMVEDVPRQFDTKSSHSIYHPTAKLRIPLSLDGISSGFVSRKPTWEEYGQYPHVELTSPMRWDPSSDQFAKKEETYVSSVCVVKTLLATDHARNASRLVSAVNSLRSLRMSIGQEDGSLGDRLVAAVNVAADDTVGDGLSGRNDNVVYPMDDESRKMFALSTSEQRSTITPEILSRRWGVGLDTAKRTLQVTTQSGIRNVLAPGEKKVRQKLDHLAFPNLSGKWYTDTMFSKTKSIRGHLVAQVFTNGRGSDHFYPMTGKGMAGPDALMPFVREVGIPQTIVTDNAPEEIGGEFGKICRKFRIKQEQTVPYSPWSNLAESTIRELKVKIRRTLRRSKAPKRLWCFCGKWVAAIRRLTALDMPQLQGRVPEEDVLGSTPDISQYAQFDWYEPVMYWDPVAGFPHEQKLLGRWVGVAEVSTDLMAFYILTKTGKIIVRKSVWGLSNDDFAHPDMKLRLAELDERIRSKIGDDLKAGDIDPDLMGSMPEIPDDVFDDEDESVMDTGDMTSSDEGTDDHTPESYDEYLTAQVLLPQGGEAKKATVVGRKRDQDGRPIGKRHANPLLDTRLYEVEFPDGSTEAIAANLIAENMLSQVDDEGRSYAVLSEIVDHRTNGHALSKDDGFVVDRQGRRHPRTTTRGWELQVEWRDGSSTWVPLSELKESNPIQVAEYAVANKIAEEPAFAWWARNVLRKRDRIIKKVKARYWAKTHKFGIELPKSVAEALRIDDRTGTDFWRKAIELEMKNVQPAFEFIDDDVVPKFYKKIDCHMIFDVKMDLTRKARLVAGGHQTDPPKESTYSSVVSRDSIRIAFTVAALNDLDVLSADVQGAYLNAPTKEKVYTTAGLEFGADKVGRPVLIVRALYGLKSSGARWRDHMAATLREGGFVSCRGDPDVWMRPKVKPNGDKYWEYVLCYVDDILCISHEPQVVMDYLASKYTLKKGSVKEPDAYLGAEVKKWTIEGADNPSKVRWAMSSDLYVKRAVTEVERELDEIGERLSTKVSTPMSQGYRPEVDTTPELDAKRANYFQGLIGVLRWICELGRVDILVDVAMLSRFLASPRRGHLDQAFHIFAYLKRYNRSSMVFDDTEPMFDESRFQKCDWSEYYPGACEAVPPDAPEVRGESVSMSCFVDADHAGCRVTRRSHTGVLIFVNRAPILWYSKRQNTVEASTFGSEFIAAKIAVEMVEGLRYKLRMMGIQVDGPTNVFCDNESVVKNSTKPESTLKKKHNAIAYHRVREAQAAGIVRIAKEDGETNLADMLTKCLPGPRLRELCSRVLW